VPCIAGARKEWLLVQEKGMQDEPNRERTARANPTALGSSASVAPSASRMLTAYLSDIEQLLDEQRWDAAVREALDLPLIAVALSDPQLRTSGEGVKTWCDEWIRPEESDRNVDGGDYEQVSAAAVAHASHEGPPMVPFLPLKRLRLRRHARTPPRGFSYGRTGSLDAQGRNAMTVCTILVEAARRWYAQGAVHDSTVQVNLARLAVLR
jgi:hypothetical protein